MCNAAHSEAEIKVPSSAKGPGQTLRVGKHPCEGGWSSPSWVPLVAPGTVR